MNLKIWYNLMRERRKIMADAKFKKQLWNNLSAYWSGVYHNNFYWYQTLYFRVAVLSLIALLVIGSFGTGVYAYTSPEVTPDNILYPIKKSLENIESLTKVTPEAKAKFYLKTIKKREEEKKVLEKRNQFANTKIIENTENQIDKTEQKLFEVNKKIEESDNLKEKVKEQLDKRQERLREKIEKIKERENINKGRDKNFYRSSSKIDEKGD